jgi:hypothetical protein
MEQQTTTTDSNQIMTAFSGPMIYDVGIALKIT